MKKFTSLLLVLLMVLSVGLTGCSTGVDGGTTGDSATEAESAVWPSEAVTILVPSRAGGFADANARMVADYLQRSTGVPFAVVNNAEGGGTIAADTVRTAEADGNTLLFMHSSFPISMYTGVYNYDPKEDFTVLAQGQLPGTNSFVVSADAPWDTVEDLVNDAKNRPGEIMWGSMAGVTSHFLMAMLEGEGQVSFKMVDAGSESEKVTALLGGHIEVTNISTKNANQHVEAGNMKVFGVVSQNRDRLYSDYPTVVEQGYDVAWDAPFGLWGPAGMDEETAERINAALAGFGDDETSVEAMNKMGAIYEHKNTEETTEMWFALYDLIEELTIQMDF